jgi:hypothetical protein
MSAAFVPISQTRKQRLSAIMELAKGHKANEQQSQALLLGLWASKPTFEGQEEVVAMWARIIVWRQRAHEIVSWVLGCGHKGQAAQGG